MSGISIQNGTRIAQCFRDPSLDNTFRAYNVKTLADLLSALGIHPPPSYPMLRSTTAQIVTYLNRPAEEISFDLMEQEKNGFRRFLEGRTYKENSVHSYVNLLRILLVEARRFGWNQVESIPKAWLHIVELSKGMTCAGLVKDMARMRKTPYEISVEDVEDWVRTQTIKGRSYRHADGKATKFWGLLVDSGSTRLTPIRVIRFQKYGIPLSQFPTNLKADVIKLVSWKASGSYKRSRGGRHREVTSKQMEATICQLTGYAINKRGETNVDSLSQLVQEPIICSYVDWMANERRAQLYCVKSALKILYGAIHKHPSWAGIDFGWFQELIHDLPDGDESELKKRKEHKYLEYEIVEAIPSKIREEKTRAAKRDVRKAAHLAVEELIMKWLIILPWRQRNLRECRIGGPSPNLFKAKIPPFSSIDKPEWVKLEERKDPGAEFWQFRFSNSETKTGIDVHAVLPRPLVGLLEEYLREFRPHLLRGSDPGTLLLDGVGTPMVSRQIVTIVGTRTLRLGGRRVTPHLFRDIVAYTWLSEHPEDYLTLSKMLWHSDIQTTIRTYGGRFNESSGVRAMESWVEKRGAK